MGLMDYIQSGIQAINPIRLGQKMFDSSKDKATAKALGKKSQQEYDAAAQTPFQGLAGAKGEFGTANEYAKRVWGPGGPGTQPGAAEQWFASNQAGGNPFDAYMRQQGTKSIMDAGSAFGNANSGATQQALANMNANLSAQQWGQMGQMAGQAQNAQQTRQMGGASVFGGLANEQARLYNPFYEMSTGLTSKGIDANLAAEIAALNISQADKDRLINGILGVGKIVTTVAGGK